MRRARAAGRVAGGQGRGPQGSPNTVSFALIIGDPDVAIQRRTDDVLHWLVFNIRPRRRTLPDGVSATATLLRGRSRRKSIRGVGYLVTEQRRSGRCITTFELSALEKLI